MVKQTDKDRATVGIECSSPTNPSVVPLRPLRSPPTDEGRWDGPSFLRTQIWSEAHPDDLWHCSDDQNG